MLDVLITGATVVDGTGAPGRRADVGVRDGRIVTVGDVDEPAAETLDADGLIAAPGFVDPHTHYDAQLFWDPTATPSNLHGVTTVIAGNCGFTLAPLDRARRRLHAPDDGQGRGDAARRPWRPASPGTGRRFGEYLGRLEGHIGVNVGFLVGHCALRRHVMGADAVGERGQRRPGRSDGRPAPRVARRRRPRASRPPCRSPTPTATASRSRPAGPAATRCWPCARAVGEHEGTTLEYVTDGCLARLHDPTRST